ncbi:hypothetical protein [Asaia bogorensis]|uniref:Uncharacterized protein n=1 Tax=Asaia bogorensis NBRC 16594 TaxID=1231624 RepID=A0AAN4U4H2_9PROT|nr:hypothetical protein [Asaia bogorensis]GBQ81386.1 hypothetical protein AA0311_2608 [Asaia bogorensis NBRC 16594]GEL54880.1 hypothetical protein ABO01nite_28870 [Asaia bogorensis NBRC 16594]
MAVRQHQQSKRPRYVTAFSLIAGVSTLTAFAAPSIAAPSDVPALAAVASAQLAVEKETLSTMQQILALLQKQAREADRASQEKTALQNAIRETNGASATRAVVVQHKEASSGSEPPLHQP